MAPMTIVRAQRSRIPLRNVHSQQGGRERGKGERRQAADLVVHPSPGEEEDLPAASAPDKRAKGWWRKVLDPGLMVQPDIQGICIRPTGPTGGRYSLRPTFGGPQRS